jgi:dTDP-4-dehydrorhamnose 3,5-epimerase
MTVSETALPGVLLIQSRMYKDDRGAFLESWNQHQFADAGLPSVWVQDNFSVSRKNVVRGIHYQIVQPQAKLVRVTHGEVFDVAVDLRRSSPHFGRHVAVRLGADTGDAFYIPAGFGHGFVALSDQVGFSYKVTDYYCPSGERTLLWNDPELRIDWGIDPAAAVLSPKDLQGRLLRDAEVFA